MSPAVADPPAPTEVRPQPGPQEAFLCTPADIGVIGGSVFGGKTWSLVYEALRNVDVEGFNFVAFRREMPQHTNPGGMWQESLKWYPAAGGIPRSHRHEWTFPSGALGKFASLPHEKDLIGWLGAQIALLLFDQLEQFTEKMFFDLIARNRSICGVAPYTRASANPDPDSFLVHFLAWWIDEDGWARPDRSGSIRWFIRVRDELVWSDVVCPADDLDNYEVYADAARRALERSHPGQGDDALSVTFVLARLQDNAIGNALDPDYIKKVRAMPHVEQQRLLGGDKGGNWKIRATAGKVFNRGHFRAAAALPARPEISAVVRYWDKAGTEGGGKYSAGVLMIRTRDNRYVIADVERGQWAAGEREQVIKQKAHADRTQFGAAVETWVEQEPGSGGKESAENTIRNLAGFNVRAERPTGDKLTRANPLAAQTQPPAQNVWILAAPWNEAFLREAHNFDGVHGVMDQIDAASGAFNKLALGPRPVRQREIAWG